METTMILDIGGIFYWCYFGITENKMEATL